MSSRTAVKLLVICLELRIVLIETPVDMRIGINPVELVVDKCLIV